MIDGLKTTEGQPVPLLGVQVQAEVLGGHTRVKIRQRYRNTESKPIEAIYTFPLPSDGTISGFAMVCEGRRLEGVVQEREEAFRNYDDAIVHGHGAALLEQERKNVFTANVGNLLSNEETLIEVEYLQRLTADEGALRWMLPTLVAPRYIPGNAQGNRTGGGWADPTDAVPDADRITPKIGDVKYGLKLELVFNLGAELEVESPSHKIVATKADGKVKVAFEQPEVALDRDIVVIARGAKGVLAGVSAHREDEQPGYFALTVVPDLFEAGKPALSQNIVFLVDTSGSMDGESLPQAISALKLCLRHLREGDRFNIMEFNSTYTCLSDSPLQFSQASLKRADQWLNSLRATGGTELLQPLTASVGMVPDGVVVLLTDGQVGNESQILDAVLKGRQSTRVYSFGIGTNVSDQLLRDLASHTGGAVEFIYPGERIDEKVTAQFAKAVAQRVTNIELKWVGASVSDVAPGACPPMIDGEPWTIFGRYEKAGNGHVEIFGKRGGAPFTLQVPVEIPERSSNPALRPLWAAERIRDWEATGVRGRRADLMKERITKLAVEYGVSSPYTSFLVVEKREGDRLAKGQPEARFVPVAQPAGWDMFKDVQAQGLASITRAGAITGASIPRLSMPPPGGAARPPPPPSAPMYSPAPSPVMSAGLPPAPSRKQGGGGLFNKMAEMAKKIGGSARNAAPTPPPPPSASMDAAPEAEEAFYDLEETTIPPATSADPVGRLMEQQLASGLWDSSEKGAENVRQAKATVRVLMLLLQHGITTSHAVYGAQVRKAIEALVQLVSTMKGEDQLIELALSAAWLLATGHRTRSTISQAAQSRPALAARLKDEVALRAQVDQAAASVGA